MDMTGKAFHEVILQADRAHFAYNKHGAQAGMYALACLQEQIATLRHHLEHVAQAPVGSE